jgi:hypothetical protein
MAHDLEGGKETAFVLTFNGSIKFVPGVHDLELKPGRESLGLRLVCY